MDDLEIERHFRRRGLLFVIRSKLAIWKNGEENVSPAVPDDWGLEVMGMQQAEYHNALEVVKEYNLDSRSYELRLPMSTDRMEIADSLLLQIGIILEKRALRLKDIMGKNASGYDSENWPLAWTCTKYCVESGELMITIDFDTAPTRSAKVPLRSILPTDEVVHRAVDKFHRELENVEKEMRMWDLDYDSYKMISCNQCGGHYCNVCGQVSSMKCGRCGKVWYCSRAHQQSDWPKHKLVCAK